MSDGHDQSSPDAPGAGWSTGYVTPGVPVETTVSSPLPAYTTDPDWRPPAEPVAAPVAPVVAAAPPGPALAPPTGPRLAPPPAPTWPAPVSPAPYTPYSAPPLPTRTRRPMRTGAILGIVLGSIGAVVVIVVVAGIAIVNAAGAPSRAASAAVTAFLTAVEKGDAAGALAQVAPPPSDTTLLTDAALTASARYGRISDISISYVSSSTPYQHVGVRLTIRGVRTTASFLVVKSGSSYRIDSNSLPRLALDGLVGVPVTIDGVAMVPRGGRVWVFPGIHSIESATPYLTLTRSSPVPVIDSLSPGTTGLTATVTDAGYQEFHALLASTVQACVAQTTLDAGCGLALPPTLSDGTQLIEGSITRSLPPESVAAIDTATPSALSGVQPAVLTADVYADVDVTARCSSGGSVRACSLSGTPELNTATVDLTAGTPTVEWN